MNGQTSRLKPSTLSRSQVWSLIRLLMLGAFILGMFVAGSVMSQIQADTTSAMQAKKIFNMVHDVSLGKKFIVDDITMANPDAAIYVFGCRDYPSDAECSIPSCTSGDLSICVCVGSTFHGCQTESYRYPIRGYQKIQSSARIRVEQKDYEGAASIVIEAVVS